MPGTDRRPALEKLVCKSRTGEEKPAALKAAQFESLINISFANQQSLSGEPWPRPRPPKA